LKRHWTNDPPHKIGNTCGIFFSVWLDTTSPKHSHRLRYNIHALKLRALPGHKLESRKFAEAFRLGFSALKQPWPNVSLDHGPQTLMEGFTDLGGDCHESDILGLCSSFCPVAPLIDDLLAQARA
jgi:hypothetical protein